MRGNGVPYLAISFPSRHVQLYLGHLHCFAAHVHGRAYALIVLRLTAVYAARIAGIDPLRSDHTLGEIPRGRVRLIRRIRYFGVSGLGPGGVHGVNTCFIPRQRSHGEDVAAL